jgi:hypothetical protein
MANPTTLYEYFSAKGQSLPSLSERAKLYESLGLGSASNYVGTGDQNTALLGKLSATQPVTAVKPTAETATYPKTSEGLVPVMPSGTPIPKPVVAPGGTTPPKTVNVQGFTIDTATGEPIDPKTGKPLTPVSGYTGVSIVDYLKSVGQPSDYASRAKLAASKGITNYTGTAEQNIQLLNMLRGTTGVTPPATTGKVLTPEQIKQYYAEEGDKASPLSPLDWLAKQEGGTVLKQPEGGVVTSEVPRTEVAKTIAEQAAKEVAEEKEIVSLQRARTIAELKKELGIDTGIPVRPVFATDFEALRSEQGMGALESQINSLETQIRDTEASLRQGLYTEEGQLRPMELIGTRQRELTRQAQEQMDTLNRRKTTLVDEYNTKVNLVNTIMQLKATDYDNAVNEYNTKFSQAIQMQNLLMSEEDRAKAEDNATRDDARANLQVMINSAKSGGITDFTKLDPRMQVEATKLGLKAGYAPGMVEFLFNTLPADEEIVYKGTQTDATGKESVVLITRDSQGNLHTKIVETGGVGTPGGEAPPTSYKEWSLAGGLEGTGKTYNEWLTSEGGNQFEFSNDDKGKMANIGLSETDINNIESDIRTYGKEKALNESGLSEDQKRSIQLILSGKANIEVFLNTEYLKGQYPKHWYETTKGYNARIQKTLDWVTAQRKTGLSDSEIWANLNK